MRIQIKLITILGLFFLNFLLCKSVNLICNRQYNLASWLSFKHNDSSPFLLKCREDITRRGDATHISSQVTIVSLKILIIGYIKLINFLFPIGKWFRRMDVKM